MQFYHEEKCWLEQCQGQQTKQEQTERNNL